MQPPPKVDEFICIVDMSKERERDFDLACTFEYQGGRYRNTGWMIYGMIVIAGND